MPFYNKALFNGYKGLPEPFNHPLTASTIQLAAVWLILLPMWFVQRVLLTKSQDNRNVSNSGNKSNSFERKSSFSWRNLLSSRVRNWTLIWNLFLPSLCFAFVIGLSNIGISKVSVNIHVIMKSAEVRIDFFTL